MAEGQDNAWEQFVGQTRSSDGGAEESFGLMAQALRGSPRRGFSWLRQSTKSPWYGPAGFFVAAALFASLPPPATFTRLLGGSEVWRHLETTYAVTGLGLLSVAAFAVQFLFAIRERKPARALIRSQSLLASAALFVASVLWLIVVVFSVLHEIGRILVTLLWLCGIGGFLWVIGRAAMRSEA